jgi:fructose-1,6-bisphosphatase/inositol monophosphatase family enzyme
MTSLREADALLARIRSIHEAIRDEVVAACEARPPEELAAVVGDDAGDTLFAVDRISEPVLLERFEALARDWPCLLVAEGLGQDGRRVLPHGAKLEDAEILILVDPIDGTRGLMYQKRPAWVLTGVAPLRGREPGTRTLADIELAVQTEIPLIKQHLGDTLWATAGGGAHAERWNRITGARHALPLRPSRATTILQGYGGLSRFFPGARVELAGIDDEIHERILGPTVRGRALAFEDQYICSAGQLYELIVGHDRWVADLRPVLEPMLAAQGRALGICSHPYDLCTELIAREAGVIVTDPGGAPLAAPLDVFAEVGWIGYANPAIRALVEPALRAALAARGLAPQS